mmetsp:Transcript_4091/g.10469  ORF Transcript_4091/g.10469 Transcript_4091/m.10469 type:complete len:216 (-) Transcript_4091:821-1468(-)
MAGFWWFFATQSSPATTSLTDPEPEQSKTRTATILALFATPVVLPTAVPATCVPCPSQSSASGSSSTKSQPWAALLPLPSQPLNSWWVLRSPESTVYIVTPRPVPSSFLRPSKWNFLSKGRRLWSMRSRFHRATFRSCVFPLPNAVTLDGLPKPASSLPPLSNLASKLSPIPRISFPTGAPSLWMPASCAASPVNPYEETRCSSSILYTCPSFST